MPVARTNIAALNAVEMSNRIFIEPSYQLGLNRFSHFGDASAMPVVSRNRAALSNTVTSTRIFIEALLTNVD